MAIKQHQSFEERHQAASILLDEVPDIPLYMDTLANTAVREYGAFPERLYIILDGYIVYQGGIGPMNYRVSEVKEWLEKYAGKLLNTTTDSS